MLKFRQLENGSWQGYNPDRETNQIDAALKELRAEADLLGVKYHRNAGVEKIRQAIDDFKREHEQG